ncbi:MFS transporter [uncultured Tistrella sp.]|uniref:spinster family MFS transporter n=1 Tax=Tistrella mobilis TaxID=171437 RepID=UPI002629BC22|nr:MFS transporter [uncultured Tistrella sp.]
MTASDGVATDRSEGGPTIAQGAGLALALLGLINLFNYMDRVLFSVLLEPIKAELGFSDARMGLLGGFAFALFYAVFGLAMGRLADRTNRVRVIAVSLALWSLATAACGLARSFIGLFAARMTVGVGEAGCVPSAHSLIGDLFPPERRAWAVSVFTGIGSLGSMIGLVVAAALVAEHGWRMVFFYFGLPGLALALVIPLVLREPPRGRFDRGGATRPPALKPALADLLGSAAVIHLLIAIPFYYVTVGLATWIPAFFQRVHGVGIADFGRSGGLALGLGVLIGTFAGGWLANRLIRRARSWEFRLPALAGLVSAPLFAATFLVGDTGLAYGLLFLAFLVSGLGMGPSMSCMQVVAGPHVRATAIAFMVFATSIISYGGAPALVGLISDLALAHGLATDGGASLRLALIVTLLPPLISGLFFQAALNRRRRIDPEL